MSEVAQSPEAVAYNLMKEIMSSEGAYDKAGLLTRDYMLSLYDECLSTTKGNYNGANSIGAVSKRR